MERAALNALQGKLEEQVKEHFPDDGVQRVVLLQHGDDPQVEPGGLWVRVFIKVAGIPSDREGSQARTLFFAGLAGRPRGDAERAPARVRAGASRRPAA